MRGWSRVAEESPKGLNDPRGFWQQILLAGPLYNVQELEKSIFESTLGKLGCEGLTGQANAKEEDGYELDLTYEIRRHSKAPFGVVACHIQCEVSRNGKKHATVAIGLELTDVGFDVESELPGYL